MCAFDCHVSNQSVEVTLEQWNALYEKDGGDYTVNRREEEKLECDPVVKGRKIYTLDALYHLGVSLTWKAC